VTHGAVANLRLQRDSRNRTIIHGVGGSITTPNARLQSFGISGMVMMDQSAAVGPASGAALRASGLLGADWLSNFDVDFDLPHRMMTLYCVQGCADDYVPSGRRAFSRRRHRSQLVAQRAGRYAAGHRLGCGRAGCSCSAVGPDTVLTSRPLAIHLTESQ
jgi:hypothetical protein